GDGIPAPDGPLVTKGVVVFGGLGGNVYGLDAATGAQLWAVHPADPSIQLSAIFGSPTQVGKYVVIGTSSNEEQGVPVDYQYTARGSVVLLDPKDGRIVWQTSMT